MPSLGTQSPAANGSGTTQGKVGLGLIIGSLGVVYGDIGTSPLYAISEAFFGHYPLALTAENILGVISLVFWSLVLVVTIKYVLLILRADNNGEGGIFALLGLLMKREQAEQQAGSPAGPRRLRPLLFKAVIVGASLLYGESIITPAISVLSAVEGLSVITPAAERYVLPTTVVILIALFAVQKHGTQRIGRLFGPIMTFWFLTIAALGAVQVAQWPGVLQAVNPWHAVLLARTHGWLVMLILGAVVLCVTHLRQFRV